MNEETRQKIKNLENQKADMRKLLEQEKLRFYGSSFDLPDCFAIFSRDFPMHQLEIKCILDVTDDIQKKIDALKENG